MKKIALLVLILIFIQILSAEFSPRIYNPTLNTPSLFNLNNIKMSHTISFSAGVNSDNFSYYQSVYTNHIFYRINSKLDLNLDLSFVNFGTATFDRGFQIEGNNDNSSRIIPEFSLNYRPSRNFNIVVEYRNLGSGYFNPYYQNRGW